MSITDARLAQIAKLEEEIQAKSAWIAEQEATLNTMQDIAGRMDTVTKRSLSKSASAATARRGFGEATPIQESEARDKDIISDLRDTLKKEYADLDKLKEEKKALEDYTKGV